MADNSVIDHNDDISSTEIYFLLQVMAQDDSVKHSSFSPENETPTM